MQINWKIKEGLQNYSKVICELEKRVESVYNKESYDHVYITEHNGVFTAGRSFVDDNEILDKSIKIIKSNRGGKLTYHGPGQRIIYPVINLDNIYYQKNIRLYINLLQQWIVNTLNNLGIESYTKQNQIGGVWTKFNNQDAKIASIGLRVRKWIAYHGAAINLSINPNNFRKIVPCGIQNERIISLIELNKFIKNKDFDKMLITEFYKLFNFYHINK